MAQMLSQSAKPVVLRKFGINETYQLAMYQLVQYRGTTLSCRYAIPSRFAPAESQAELEKAFMDAVVETVMKHPMMQVGMTDATSKIPSWIKLQSLDLAQHIYWVLVAEDADFEQTVQDNFSTQLDERFPDLSVQPTQQPGWKITIFCQGSAPTMEVMLTWNHPWFDGAGARVFHEDLLEILNAESGKGAQTNGDILALPQASPSLPIPIESLKSLPVDIVFLVKALWEDTRPEFLNRDVSYASWCPIHTTAYKTQYRAFFMDNTALSAILALCRKNKTTITALINGLALLAFSLRLDSRAAPAFQSSTIIDHRRNLPPAEPGTPWGPSDRLVARIRAKLPTKANTDDNEGHRLSADLERELWAVSAQNRQEIVDKLENGLRNDLVGLFKWVTNRQQTMKDMAKKTRQFTWLVTNIGVLDGNRGAKLRDALGNGPQTGRDSSESSNDGGSGSGSWSISRAQFGLSAEIPAAAIEFGPVSVAGQGMCISAIWNHCAVDTTLADRIMADLERWLVKPTSRPTMMHRTLDTDPLLKLVCTNT